MSDSPGTGRIYCIVHISHYADPQKFHQLLDQFDQETPDCPWNYDAAETLAMPPLRRGWLTSYVVARENWHNYSAD